MTKTAKKIEELPTRSVNTDIKNFIKRAETIEDEMGELKAEKKDLYKEIKAGGINMKAFRAALAIKRKPPEPEFLATVNLYLEAGGQYSIFKD